MTQTSQISISGSDVSDSDGSYNNWSLPLDMTSSSSSSSSSSLPPCPKPGEEIDTVSMYIVVAILTVLSVSGTAGNALVMYVFSKKKDKLVSTLFILVLAFVDFVTCLVVIPYTVYMEYFGFAMAFDFFCKLYQFLITSNIPFSAFIMVAIAVDRYFCICHPFLHAVTVLRAKLIVAVLAVLSAAIGVCVSLMYSVYVGRTTESGVPCGGGGDEGDSFSRDATNGTAPFDAIRYHSSSETTVDDDDDVVYSASYPIEEADDGGGGLIYSGICQPSELVVGLSFRAAFQKFYTALYLLCLVVVIALYVLIYRSVLARRTRRQNEKSKSLSLVVASTACRGRFLAYGGEETLFTTDGIDAEPPPTGSRGGDNGCPPSKGRRREAAAAAGGLMGRKSISLATKWDLNRMANLKTAAMLFVVTVVFVLTFLPAFLMALDLMPYNIIVFYMYFANNVANPVIYSFMNKNFRDDTKRLLCR